LLKNPSKGGIPAIEKSANTKQKEKKKFLDPKDVQFEIYITERFDETEE